MELHLPDYLKVACTSRKGGWCGAQIPENQKAKNQAGGRAFWESQASPHLAGTPPGH